MAHSLEVFIKAAGLPVPPVTTRQTHHQDYVWCVASADLNWVRHGNELLGDVAQSVAAPQRPLFVVSKVLRQPGALLLRVLAIVVKVPHWPLGLAELVARVEQAYTGLESDGGNNVPQ